MEWQIIPTNKHNCFKRTQIQPLPPPVGAEVPKVRVLLVVVYLFHSFSRAECPGRADGTSASHSYVLPPVPRVPPPGCARPPPAAGRHLPDRHQQPGQEDQPGRPPGPAGAGPRRRGGCGGSGEETILQSNERMQQLNKINIISS